ncbi:hypothetical protein ACFONG_16210 [Uliginosibacterium paludis]|uniref:DUF304 domain-containing protein n=1 Tax=Uliginosibacterium paludis TaxID=1615952 RepID=A0ABV2CVU5_9RHOO
MQPLKHKDTTLSSLSNLPQALQDRVRSELKSGESVMWAGQPNPNRFMRSGFKIWFFFIPWTAFSLFWIAGAAGFEMPHFDSGWSLFPLFGLPFLLVGIGGLSAPLWLRRRARFTVYVLTNRRAISIDGAKTITVKSYPASEIAGIERVERQDGSGDLILRTEYYRDSDGDRQTRQHGFFSIDEVRSVENLVEALLRNKQAPSQH